MKSNIGTYEMIRLLNNTNGITIGNYKYILDGDVIEGYYYVTSEVLKNNKFIPVEKIICSDGWVDATNFKNILTNTLHRQ